MKLSLLGIIFMSFLVSNCKRSDKTADPAPQAENVKMVFVDVPEVQQASIVTFTTSFGQFNNVNVEIDKTNLNSLLFAKNVSGAILFLSFPIDGKIELSYEHTALSLVKIMLNPFLRSPDELSEAVSIIKLSSSYKQLITKISESVVSGNSPIDSDEVMLLAYQVAADANAKFSTRRAHEREITKRYFFGSPNSLEGQSVWMEEVQENKSLRITSNSRVAWALRLEDGEGKLIQEEIIEASEFADDFTKITSYLSNIDPEDLEYSEYYRAKIFQNDNSMRRQVYTLVSYVTGMIIEYMPWEKNDQCYKHIIELMVADLFPKFASIGDPAKNPSEYTARLKAILSSILYSPSFYEGAGNVIIECEKINMESYVKRVGLYNKDLAKVFARSMHVFNLLNWPVKLTKFGFFIEQFVSYSAKEYIIERLDDPLFSCNVNGVPYNFNALSFVKNDKAVLLSGNIFEQGKLRWYYQITFAPIQAYTGVGNYKLTHSLNLNGDLRAVGIALSEYMVSDIATSYPKSYSFGNDGWSAVVAPPTGFLAVTKEDDKFIEGTFEFTTSSDRMWWTPSVTVTKGKFRAKKL